MAKGCRDCSRCTESAVTGLLMAPIRVTLWMFGGCVVGLFQQKCPTCGHRMRWHRVINGRFAD